MGSRDIHQVKTISKEVLRQRTDDYHRWVEAFAKKRKIPMESAEKGVRKEDLRLPACAGSMGLLLHSR